MTTLPFPLRPRRTSFATRKLFLAALFLAALILAVLSFSLPSHAQETGVSHPPASEVYEPSDGPGASIPEQQAKPSPAQYATTPAEQPVPAAAPVAQTAPTPTPVPQPTAQPVTVAQDPDGMIVGDMPAVAQTEQNAPVPAPFSSQINPQLAQRPVPAYTDPDGDIVNPRPAQPGELVEGTVIRIRLINRLSSAHSSKGTVFKGNVASDVLSNGQVLIPTGSEIDGQVIQVSSGDHLGASGFMRLRPEILILPDGASYRINSVVSGAPGSHAKVNDEGTVKPGSRIHRDEIEYGGVVGGGVVTGALLGGPVGALTGGAIGAGVVTTHLLVSHPQAVLEPNTVLLVTLTSALQLNLVTPPSAQNTTAEQPATTN